MRDTQYSTYCIYQRTDSGQTLYCISAFISIFRSKVIHLNILVEPDWKFSELLPHACRKFTP